MDEPARDEEAARPQSTRSSIPSFLFISFMLFMLTNHNSEEFLARNHYQDALQSLEWQSANYTGWLNGTETNFTLPNRNPALEPLLDAFMTFGPRLDPEYASYYSNVTGFVRGDTAFHNITPAHFSTAPSTNPAWMPSAEALMTGINMTELTGRLGSWNWTASDKVALSVMEKMTVLADRPAEKIALIHGRIELTDSNSTEDLRLEFEGVHFVANGSIYGFAEPSGRKIDIRLLPSLVPEAYRNATARAIQPELTARIAKLRNLIDGGIIDQDMSSGDDISPRTTCPFTFYGQIEPADVPEDLMQTLEEELQNPTGIWTIPTPKLSLEGVLLSQECGILYEIKETEGLRSRTFFRKVTTYASLAALFYLALLVLLSRQMTASHTPAGLSRLSRWTFLTQALVDAVSFAGHITFAILAEGRVSLSLIAPAFLACVLFVYEAQFALLIHQIQLPEDVAVPPPQPILTPSPAPPALPTPESPLPATRPTADADTATPTPAPAGPPSPPSPSFLSLFIAHLRSDPQARLWVVIFIFMSFIVRIVLSPSLALLFVGSMYSLFWTVQIVRAVRRGRSGALTKEYLLGSTVCRLWFAMYYLACPRNVLDVEPREWVYLLACFMFLQVGLLISQDYFGPAFFLPKRYAAVPTYDYHPPMPLVDSEALEQSLGDCAICMDSIQVDSTSRRRSKSSDGKEKGDDRGGLLGAVQISGTRKNYSLAPCHHLFHTACLERWLAIKNICPQCRRPLPPL